ncbi:hypothetical protein AB833_22095 [Chromatiales bacterium (ex Bugula neritina AB1)]|nr:hypothetical protein AB833_22095 [Chromatiales bacterium (ex Bugula neritina AB1)]
MIELKVGDFAEYFESLYGFAPMGWQIELAELACAGKWPGVIDVPTGGGKTAAIDVAVYALAVQAGLPVSQRTAAMRTFLVVDRRTVVSDAYTRAAALAEKLANARDGVLKRVADALRSYLPDERLKPLNAVELRGGIYRDPGWLKALTQPMVVCSTVDQLGSRLLFRGYGVGQLSRSIQAGALAYDTLVLLDEAHISRPFANTLNSIASFQRPPWNSAALARPLTVVEMTATPAIHTANRLSVNDSELIDGSTRIGRIVNTSKLAELILLEKAKGARAIDRLAAGMEELAVRLTASGDDADIRNCRRIGVFCNTIGAAKAVYERLLDSSAEGQRRIQLLIGPMRPIDREAQNSQLRECLKTDGRQELDTPLLVVATQCIEVGADYDFDGVVTEAAPVDSLVQRFGRLNRGGEWTHTGAYIVLRGDHEKDDGQLGALDEAYKYVDPVYGNAAARTWNWLKANADEGRVDFGILEMKRQLGKLTVQQRERISSDSADSPALLPAHVNLLCQTSSLVWPEPRVSVWLHGPERDDPMVMICWRADLQAVELDSRGDIPIARVSLNQEVAELTHIVSLCPPSAYECMSVSLRRVKVWLNSLQTGEKPGHDQSADIPSSIEVADDDFDDLQPLLKPLIWRGSDDSILLESAYQLRPGDTLVCPVLLGGWSSLGHIPGVEDPVNVALVPEETELADGRTRRIVNVPYDELRRASAVDCASAAFFQSRRRPIIRCHASLVDSDLLACTKPESGAAGLTADKWARLLGFLPMLESCSDLVSCPYRNLELNYYPGDRGVVIVGPAKKGEHAMIEDHTVDNFSKLDAGDPVELGEHCRAVQKFVSQSVSAVGSEQLRQTFYVAAVVHDWGKADERFQAMLFGGDMFRALSSKELYAKSSGLKIDKLSNEYTRLRAGLPARFRHELLSASLLEVADDQRQGVEDEDLLYHLVASHHGYARPLAPVCIDETPPTIVLDAMGLPNVQLTEGERKKISYHRLDSPIPARFWRVNDHYGWWGLAYLETILRLADQFVSWSENQHLSSCGSSASGDDSLLEEDVSNG